MIDTHIAQIQANRQPVINPLTTAPVYSRRTLLRQLVAIGLVGLGGASLLAACGSKNEDSPAPVTPPPANGAATTSEVVSATCEGYTALTAAEQQMRPILVYVDKSSIPAQLCSNCHFYQKPAAGAACGGCQIIKGPIAPGGHCNSWVAA